MFANTDFTRFAKKFQKISTHLLTVLISNAILHIEQREQIEKSRKAQVPAPKYHSPSGGDYINILSIERRNDL